MSPEFRQRDPGFTLHWDLLRLPELATRLVLTPLFPLLVVAEKTRVDRRIEDLVTNADHSRVLLPVFVALTRDGIGGGILYNHANLFGSGEELKLFGLIKTNADLSLSGGYSEKVPALDGRRLGLALHYDVDHNERYYGIGPDTVEEDQRALEAQTTGARLELDVGGPNTYFTTGFGSEAHLGYTRERLEAGSQPGVRALGAPDDSVVPPPGFDDTVDYALAGFRFSYDQRDLTGRTHRGFLVEFALDARTDLNDRHLNGAKSGMSFAYFLPVAPRYRVLVASAGMATTTPLGQDAEVPFGSLVRLGRSSGLRGYTDRRFIDRSGWWSSLEYRYPIFDFDDTGAGLSAALFIDAGGVARSPEDFFEESVRYAPGVGLRAEVPGVFVLTAHIARSPDGFEASLGVNEHYELPD